MVTVPGPMLERAVEAAVGDGFVAGTVVRTVSLPMIDTGCVMAVRREVL